MRNTSRLYHQKRKLPFLNKLKIEKNRKGTSRPDSVCYLRSIHLLFISKSVTVEQRVLAEIRVNRQQTKHRTLKLKSPSAWPTNDPSKSAIREDGA